MSRRPDYEKAVKIVAKVIRMGASIPTPHRYPRTDALIYMMKPVLQKAVQKKMKI